MRNSIYNKNNKLPSSTNPFSLWHTVENNQKCNKFTSEIAQLCMTNEQDKRWILCVDGNDSEVYRLAESVDKSKFLRVNGQQNKIPFDKIQSTLLKGNCSTIVLCDPAFSPQELRTLQLCAVQGQTKVIVLNNSKPTMH